MTFAERLKIGSSGEAIIRDYLINKGWIVYAPENSSPHPFDFLCYKDGESFIAEVKTKARMKQFRATGIDYRHYKIYKSFEAKHNIPVYLFFVDYNVGAVYGNYLSELEKPRTQAEGNCIFNYPMVMRRSDVIVFPLDAMEIVAVLPEGVKFKEKYN